jgi:LuxR family maltose regulon positive regulatory protein
LPIVREYGFIDELMSGYLVAPKLHFARGDVTAAFRALDDANSVALELGIERFATNVLGERIRLLLRTGRVEQALELGRARGIPADMREVSPLLSSTSRDEVLAATWTRLAMSQGDVPDALVVTQRWKQFCSHRGATRHLIRWNLLHAQLLLIRGDLRAAQRSLREALVAAADSRTMRVFLDEGAMIHELLTESYGKGLMTKHPANLFAYDLLSTFESRSRARLADGADDYLDREAGLDGKMSGREIEILTFVASGLRNREIGDRLGLTEGSVKWYMQRIYDKVGTRRRSVAVERARQFGLLD